MLHFIGLVIAIGLGVALAPLILRLSLGALILGVMLALAAAILGGLAFGISAMWPDLEAKTIALIVANFGLVVLIAAGFALSPASPKPEPRKPWQAPDKPYIDPLERQRQDDAARDYAKSEAQKADDAAVLARALARYDAKRNKPE